jgi:hypothetical protein
VPWTVADVGSQGVGGGSFLLGLVGFNAGGEIYLTTSFDRIM